MNRLRLLPLAVLLFAAISLVAQTLDPSGFLAHPNQLRRRLPTTNLSVTFEVDENGAAVFYSSVQPFHGVAITPDGRNIYLGR
jgi:hypothetical protein